MTSSVVPVFTKSANGACYNKKKKFPLGCPPAVHRSRKSKIKTMSMECY